MQEYFVFADMNGDLEIILTNEEKFPRPHSSPPTPRRLSTASGPVVNGIDTHEHNVTLMRRAIKEVKKPGKGNLFLFVIHSEAVIPFSFLIK